MSLDDIIPVKLELGDAQPFERAVAMAINDALPLLERQLPMTAEGVAILRGRVAGGLDLFLTMMVKHREGTEEAKRELDRLANPHAPRNRRRR